MGLKHSVLIAIRLAVIGTFVLFPSLMLGISTVGNKFWQRVAIVLSLTSGVIAFGGLGAALLMSLE